MQPNQPYTSQSYSPSSKPFDLSVNSALRTALTVTSTLSLTSNPNVALRQRVAALTNTLFELINSLDNDHCESLSYIIESLIVQMRCGMVITRLSFYDTLPTHPKIELKSLQSANEKSQTTQFDWLHHDEASKAFVDYVTQLLDQDGRHQFGTEYQLAAHVWHHNALRRLPSPVATHQSTTDAEHEEDSDYSSSSIYSSVSVGSVVTQFAS